MAKLRPADLIKPPSLGGREPPPALTAPPAPSGEEWRPPRPGRGGGIGPEEPRPRRRRGAWIVGSLLLFVFLAFAGVVWLAYQDGGAGADGEVPLITADARPFKVAPGDPGGLEVPNQRLSVNVLLGSEPAPEASETARVAPVEPEVARFPPGPPEEAEEEVEPEPAPTAAPREPEPPAAAAQTTETPAAPAPEPQPEPPAAAPPAPVAAAPAPTAPPARPTIPPPAVAATEPTVTTRPAEAGGRVYRVQLAAVKDEGRAQQAQSELWLSYGDVLRGVEARIERAEIGDSVFFRIQAGSFESRDAANQLCAELKARQAACIVVSG